MIHTLSAFGRIYLWIKHFFNNGFIVCVRLLFLKFLDHPMLFYLTLTRQTHGNVKKNCQNSQKSDCLPTKWIQIAINHRLVGTTSKYWCFWRGKGQKEKNKNANITLAQINHTRKILCNTPMFYLLHIVLCKKNIPMCNNNTINSLVFLSRVVPVNTYN